MNILDSKLMVPRRRDVLRRERLTRLFRENIHKRLFVVTAGAGFGKTTLVLDALETLELRPVWYLLDEQDTDFQVFMGYLHAAVERQAGDGRKAADGGGFRPSGIRAPNAVLMEWLALVQKEIRQPTAIILDDYHLVQQSPSINAAVEFILQRLPDHIRLVIIGRKKLPLELSRLRVQEKLLEITEAELCFSHREIERFFGPALGISPPDVEQIQETTRGWVASLVLLRYAFSKKSTQSVADGLAHLTRRPDLLSAYLKENVFDRQPAETRNFLMKAALLPEIDARRCATIFKVEDADRILGRMLADHLMIFPVDDSETVFRLHHLFRDFLLEQLQDHFAPDEIARLHCDIAQAYAQDDIYLALEHFVAGQDFRKTIEIIEARELELLLGGRVHFLEQCLNRIPESVVAKNPKLLLSRARIRSHHGKPEEAIALTSRALKLFRRCNADAQMIDCFIELGTQYYYTGHLKEAKLLMEQVIDSIAPDSQAYVIAMTFLTFLPPMLGEFDLSRRNDRAARENIAGYPPIKRKMAEVLLDTSLVHTLFFVGEFEYSQHVSQRLLKRILQMNIEPCLPLVYYQLSTNCYFLGRWENGCDQAHKGISACERISLADSRKGWVYLAWAQNLFGLGQFEDAGAKLEQSIQLFENPGNRWGLASAWEFQATLYLAQDKRGPALRILESALDLVKGHGLKVTRGILENSYAKALQAGGQFSESLAHLASARPDLAGAAYHLFNNHLLCAHAYFKMDEPVQSMAHLVDALALSGTHSYAHFLRDGREWLLPLLDLAGKKNIAGHTELLACTQALWPVEMVREPPVLNVSLLGKFQLRIGETELPATAWKSAKALLLFKYLAAHENHGYIPKDFLMELLWPEQDPGKTGSRFNMAMSALRKTLEPELPPKAPSSYIDRKKDTYRLFETRCNTDVQQFAALVAKARKTGPEADTALTHYVDACDLYRGPFLEEDRYEQWCIDIRETLSRRYLDMLQALVAIFEARKDDQQALVYARKLLEAAPLNEEALITLMRLYAGTGAVARIKAAYETYCAHAAELDIPVSDEISRLVQCSLIR